MSEEPEPKKNFCPYCGEELPELEGTCPGCGVNLGDSRDNKNSMGEQNSTSQDQKIALQGLITKPSNLKGIRCIHCKGTGFCKFCKGVGSVNNTECVQCGGTGRCTICQGRGVL